MKKINLDDVLKYVENNIGIFHKKRIQSIDRLKLSKVLRRKNPYLFKAKYILTSEEIIKFLVDAHISSN
ncbi:MAG: PmeII family type II restriction endonuclease, partial [Atribacterota bacterium]|nr:PmeII family type II restriction endonuclease [Atribacterota bacterium]